MPNSSDSSSSDFSLSKLSLNSSEDWDRSLNLSDSDIESLQGDSNEESSGRLRSNTATTPRNSVVFPGDHETPKRSSAHGNQGKGKRSLSDLLRLHAEKGTDVKFSPAEAARIADVLNNWVNTSPSPYEDEDDFFARSQDDLAVLSANKSTSSRSRGQSESSVNSRPPSAAGSIKT